MAGKLTDKQRLALQSLRKTPMSAYAMRVTINTMTALLARGMVRLPDSPGNAAFPRSAVWEITDRGRAVLGSAEK